MHAAFSFGTASTSCIFHHLSVQIGILVQNRGKIFLFSPQHIPKPRDDACEFEEMRVIREWGGVFEWGCRGKGGGIFESYLESS